MTDDLNSWLVTVTSEKTSGRHTFGHFLEKLPLDLGILVILSSTVLLIAKLDVFKRQMPNCKCQMIKPRIVFSFQLQNNPVCLKHCRKSWFKDWTKIQSIHYDFLQCFTYSGLFWRWTEKKIFDFIIWHLQFDVWNLV